MDKTRARFRFIKPYLVKHKIPLLAGLGFVLVQKAADQVTPWMVKKIVDALTAGAGLAVVLPFLGIIAVFAALSAVLMYYQRLWVSVASRRMEYSLRNDLFKLFQAQPKKFTDVNPIGKLMSNATNDLDKVRDYTGPVILHLTGMLTLLIFTLVSMYLLNPRLVWLGLFPVLTLPLLVHRVLRKMHTLYKKIQEDLSNLNSFVQDTLTGIQVVKAYGAEKIFLQKFTGASGELKNTSIKVNLFTSMMWPLISIFSSLGLLLAVWLGSRMVLKEEISLGMLSAALLYLLKLQFPLAGLGWVANLLQRSNASMDRLIELKQKCADSLKEYHAKPESPLPLIEEYQENSLVIQNLTFTYPTQAGKTQPALKNINLAVPEGTSLGVVGPTGSGKSTLINLICNVYSPPPGTIYYNDLPVESYGPPAWKALFSLAPQDGFLFSTSIRENIEMGQSEDPAYNYDEAGEIAGFTQDLGQITGGYEALLGERGINLSGGQRQRVGLARSLMASKKILCLDDTLSALDSETEARVLENLKSNFKGQTLILVSHRYSTISHCDHIIFLKQGSILEQGTHRELLALKGEYAAVFQKQAMALSLENNT